MQYCDNNTLFIAGVNHTYISHNNDSSILTFSVIKYSLSFTVMLMIPTILVIVFTVKIIFRVFDEYNKRFTAIHPIYSIPVKSLHDYEINVNLFLVLFLSILKDLSYILVTEPSKFVQVCPLVNQTLFYVNYEIFRITSSLNSIVYFWMNKEFRISVKNYLFYYKNETKNELFI